MRADIASLERRNRPYTHWLSSHLIDEDIVREINAQWPCEGDADWLVEERDYVKKRALLFPRRLPDAAQALAAELFSSNTCAYLSELIGFPLWPDPWFLDGPLEPKLGGGLHEIYPGGLLKMHVDFTDHPAGMRRAANLLIYLNEDWSDAWGGALELSGKTIAKIHPHAGTAVFFETGAQSWHGHPHPMQCPSNRRRRSLALYYYAQPDGNAGRPKTVYRRD